MDCLAPPLANPAKATTRAQLQQGQPVRLVPQDRPDPRDQPARLVPLETVTVTAAKDPRDQLVPRARPDPRDQPARLETVTVTAAKAPLVQPVRRVPPDQLVPRDQPDPTVMVTARALVLRDPSLPPLQMIKARVTVERLRSAIYLLATRPTVKPLQL